MDLTLFSICSSRKASFESLVVWLDDLKRHCTTDTVIALVGNKIDLPTRAISTEEGLEFAQRFRFSLRPDLLTALFSDLEHQLLYFEVSAKTGENIDAPFIEAAKKVFETRGIPV